MVVNSGGGERRERALWRESFEVLRFLRFKKTSIIS